MKNVSLLAIAIACSAGVAACSPHSNELTDAQISTLLRNEHKAAVDTSGSIDPAAVDCLRSWSGDSELLKGLAVRYAGEDGKKACREKLDDWFANPMRNPSKIAFATVSDPKVVRRAMALMASYSAVEMANAKSHQIPAALAKPIVARPPTVLAADPTVDLGAPGQKLKEAEDLCMQVQQVAATPDANATLKKYAGFCTSNLRMLRVSMEQAARSGQSVERLDSLATGATNLANTARNLLAAGKS